MRRQQYWLPQGSVWQFQQYYLKNKSDNIISGNNTDNSKKGIGSLSGNNGSGSSHSNSNHIGITIDENDSDNNVYNNENDSSGTNIDKKTK